MRIGILERADERTDFSSGNQALDDYFHRYAGQNQFRHHVSVNYVAIDDGKILGYAAIAAGELDVNSLPRTVFGNLPNYAFLFFDSVGWQFMSNRRRAEWAAA